VASTSCFFGGGGEAVGISEQNLVNLLENYNNRLRTLLFNLFFNLLPSVLVFSKVLLHCRWVSQVGSFLFDFFSPVLIVKILAITLLRGFLNMKKPAESRL